MKKTYIKPLLETYLYSPEKGFATSVGLANENRMRDYMLIEGEDRGVRRASDELTEYTNESGEYETGMWSF